MKKKLSINVLYFKIHLKKIHADFHGKNPQIDSLLNIHLRYFSSTIRGK